MDNLNDLEMINQPSSTPLMDSIIDFLKDVLDEKTINEIKLAKSFMKSYYNAEKHSKVSTVLNFQISDGDFFFSVNINKDKDGNVILFNIKKDTL